ncbi:LysR family transcriptional regulator [Arthrobacter crystallopoietes]|uniref:DNA-binding transcriptional regulator, LysR family n=1 Tax=Crystallibacter crystallopoietes TaxID=37928 RepID=A0A1H1D6H3_9MICC|nr:LysR family transcriptional regulator [Arthrobacter crystallopoietes]AUI50461.1 LysR family transcriptional regulator [Arthrobacter crystallopoietes]SDQ71446.1 DNA-binding transcriptional regulator, LysR family [Arthrobacter crystallopoietes]
MTEAHADSAMDADLARLASIDLNLLVPLLALLEERSVTKAAGKVGLSQPAMSHGLSRTRRLLNDDLLVRQGRSMVLTPRAAELIAPLRQVLDQAARIVSASSFDPAVDTRLITVAMTNSTAFVIGSELSRLLAERAPNAVLRLRTTSSATSTAFAEEAADVVLLPEAFPMPHPRERLYDDRWMVIASWNEPREADALQLLKTVSHVFPDEPSERLRPYEILDEKKIPYRVRQRVSDHLFVPHLIAQSGGGVAVHRYQVGLEFEGRFDLRVEEFPFPIDPLGIDMIWNPWLAEGAFKSWLREILIEAAEPLRARYVSSG